MFASAPVDVWREPLYFLPRPGFLSLSLADQMSVLQSVWLEVLVLGVAYRSLGCEDEVVFAEDFVLDEEMSRVAGLTELNAAISQLARRFRALQLDREEFVMLKAIALTNSGALPVKIFLLMTHSFRSLFLFPDKPVTFWSQSAWPDWVSQ